MKKVDVAIIGAGTSGLTARKQVSKVTENYVVIDNGPLGTTCARVGCMPSKVMIQAGNDFYRRKSLAEMGIHGGENLSINLKETWAHVRKLRDRFVRAVKNPMAGWEDKLIRGHATFVDANTLKVGDEEIKADKIIIATGSRPIIPGPWLEHKDYLITTDELFELEEPPKSLAVIGTGVIGIELGQAMHRLGMDVVNIGLGKSIGGLTDPKIQDYVVEKFQKEMPLSIEGASQLSLENGKLKIVSGSETHLVDKAVVAVGRRPNLDKLNLEVLNLEYNEMKIPKINANIYNLVGHEHIYLVGDVNGDRPILHEAADEGNIAGYNAVHEPTCFRRRTPLGITFSEPNIATVGKRYQDLIDEKAEFVTGEVSFEGQGRSIVKLKEQGILHIYADTKYGKILGAELQAPDGEHLAHLIAWAISLKLTVDEALSLPFYHPVIEEGLRTAIRDARHKLERGPTHLEIFRCGDTPIR